MHGWLAALSRKTTTGRFIAEVDGLRFVAIALVIGSHLRYFLAKQSGAAYVATLDSSWFAATLGRGSIGVELFFAISGFILGMPFASAHLRNAPAPSLRAYFVRRLTRLEPPYLIALLGFFVLRIAVQHADPVELAPHLAASSVYLHNVAYGTPSTVLAVAWSLEIEVQFYVLAPLLALVFFARPAVSRRLALGAAIVGLAALRGFVIPIHSFVAELTLVGHLQFFLVGFLIADLYLTTWAERPRSGALGDVLAAIGLAVLLLGVPARYGPSMLVEPLAIGLIIHGAFRGVALRWVLRRPLISTIGGMCYSIYLLHFPVITEGGLALRRFVVHGVSFVSDYIRLAAVMVPIVVAVSAVYFALIERPCMERDWPRRLWRRLGGHG